MTTAFRHDITATMSPRITPEKAKKIADYLLVETKLEPADVCIVFGNRDLALSARRAAELYHRGLFKQIVVSGGVEDRASGLLQAEYLGDELVRRGVPAKAILKENMSTNTGENVQFSMALLDSQMGLDNIKSVMAVGRIEASRRYLMTIERWMPGKKLMIAPVSMHAVPKEQWHTDPKFRNGVLKELGKLPGYFKKGFIAEVKLTQHAPQAGNENTRRPQRRKSPGFKPR